MLSGTVTAAASVGISRRMKIATTISTRATLISRDCSTWPTLPRIVPVRSDRKVTLMSGGIQASSCGSAALTRSTVSMTFAPADLVMVSRIAGCVPCQAASLVLATLLVTDAMSPRRTTAPLLVFSTRLA